MVPFKPLSSPGFFGGYTASITTKGFVHWCGAQFVYHKRQVFAVGHMPSCMQVFEKPINITTNAILPFGNRCAFLYSCHTLPVAAAVLPFKISVGKSYSTICR